MNVQARPTTELQAPYSHRPACSKPVAPAAKIVKRIQGFVCLGRRHHRPGLARISRLLLGTVLLLPNLILANQDGWAIKRDTDGIQLSTRTVTGSKHKAVRAEMEIDVALNELVGLVMDTKACPEWVALCKKSEILDQDSATELHIYTLNDLPWPAKDRDVVANVIWSEDSTGKVTMQAKLVAGFVPEIKKAVRLTQGTMAWVFSPVSNTRTRIVSEAHIDPGGATPAWLTNMLLIDQPYETMKNLRILAQSGRYREANPEFLRSQASEE